MSGPSSPTLDLDAISTRLIPLRLLVGAMVAGQVVLALAATWLLALGVGPRPQALAFLLAALALVGAGEVAVWPVVRAALIRGLRAQGAPTLEAALATFLRLRTIAATLAESFGLLGIVAYGVTGSQAALAAPALSILVLLRVQPEPEAFRNFARSSGVPGHAIPDSSD